jgi:hypothetical protein
MTTWWVNQGRTFEGELPRAYLFAPLRDKTGRQLDHWEAMTDLRPGDTVIHYAKGEVRAVSSVKTAAIRATRPVPLTESWFNTGRIAHVEVQNATVPIPLESIPRALRAVEPHGPFDVRGGVRQAYLFPVSRRFASAFFALFGERFGADFQPE